MEKSWRPRDAAERAHTEDRVAWHHETHPAQLQPDDEGTFTAEEPSWRPEEPEPRT
jgi:hypothetical protein